MKNTNFTTRHARPGEFATIGQLMTAVYSAMEGFPKPAEQPAYYQLLANVGNLTANPSTALLVAVDHEDHIKGAVVYIGDMQYYGSGGTATLEKAAAGFRLLAVAPDARGLGIGKLLTLACIDKAKQQGARQVVIHTTRAMQTAWKLYENMGFRRSEDLDFLQGTLPVFGFRLPL